MRRIMAMFAGVFVFMSSILPGSHADSIVELPIKNISLIIPSIDLPTAKGSVPTGDITVSLQSGMADKSFARFDLTPQTVATDHGLVTTQTVSTDQFLQFNFPLLSGIGSPPPTLEFRENGPVTVGINRSTGEVAVLGNLRGGGTFDDGSIFGGALMYVNDTTNIFSPIKPEFPPPPMSPITLNPPFPPLTLPDPRQLPNGFQPATMSDVQTLLASETTVMSSFSINGIFRTQTGDIPFFSKGQLGSIPEPSSVVMLGTGLLGLLGFGWWHRTRANA